MPSVRQRISARLCWALATGGGLGTIPIAPGTFGALPGFALAAAVHALDRPLLQVGLLLACSLAAVPIASWGERFYGRKDPPPVVIDEIVGLPITAAFVPPTPLHLAAAFLVNRALDIIKPFPARRLQALPGGWGIVIDDVVSSVYAGLMLAGGNRLAGEALAAGVPVGWLHRLF